MHEQPSIRAQSRRRKSMSIRRLDDRSDVWDEHLYRRVVHDLSRITRGLTIVSAAACRDVVRLYYAIQKMRVRSQNQSMAAARLGRPREFSLFVTDVLRELERVIAAALGDCAARYRVGQWLQGISGVGPVLSAGLLATFDVRVGHVGHWYRYAGICPGIVWQPGQKRPWSAFAKTLVTFRLGECLIKQKSRPGGYYGRLYEQAKRRYAETHPEWTRGHIHNAARRWMVKRFLSHLWEVCYEDYYGQDAPMPYPIAILGHADYEPPPAWPGEYDGLRLTEFYRDA